MKKTLYILVALVVVIIAVVVTFFDSISNKVAQEYATKYLKTPVSISNVKTEWSDHKATISGIKIANLPEYNSENALSIGNIQVQIDQEDDVMIINDLTIDDVMISFEQRGSGINLYQLYDNLEANSEELQKQYNNGSSDSKDGLKFIIKELNITNVRVNIDTKFFSKSITLPPIKLTNIGQQENGIPAMKLPTTVMGALLDEISDSIEKAAVKPLEDTFKQGKDVLNDLKNNLGDKTQELLKGLGIQ